MKLVVIESPYAGDIQRNLRYVRACMRDSLGKGEAPFASHALYTQPGVLDDAAPEERRLGIVAGYEWGEVADAVVFYTDLGWSPGMLAAEERLRDGNGPALVEQRSLGPNWDIANE